MNALLYVAIWLSLGLLALAELARATPSRPWARGASFAGWLLLVAHILLALGLEHDWQHASALAATARQTREIYSIDWGGGLYVNYAFLALWAFELWSWNDPAPSTARRLLWRGTVLLMVSNGAIVFAAGWRRASGVLVVLALLWAWRPAHRVRARQLPPQCR